MEELTRLYKATLLTVASLIELTGASVATGRLLAKHMKPLLAALYTESKKVEPVSKVLAEVEEAGSKLIKLKESAFSRMTDALQSAKQLKAEKEKDLLKLQGGQEEAAEAVVLEEEATSVDVTTVTVEEVPTAVVAVKEELNHKKLGRTRARTN